MIEGFTSQEGHLAGIAAQGWQQAERGDILASQVAVQGDSNSYLLWQQGSGAPTWQLTTTHSCCLLLFNNDLLMELNELE